MKIKMRSRNRLSHVVIAALVLGVTISPFAIAKTGSAILGGKTNTYSGQTFFEATNNGSGFRDFGTRFTNKGSGGGAILATHGTGAAMRATNKTTSAAALGLSVQSEKGPAASFTTNDSTAAPFTVSNSNEITNLHASNSESLGGQSASHYGAAGVRVQTTGVAFSSPTAYGLDTTQGNSGVSRSAAGTYTVFLNGAASDQFLIQVTSATPPNTCAVSSVSSGSGSVGVTCSDAAGAATDTAFYFTATKP